MLVLSVSLAQAAAGTKTYRYSRGILGTPHPACTSPLPSDPSSSPHSLAILPQNQPSRRKRGVSAPCHPEAAPKGGQGEPGDRTGAAGLGEGRLGRALQRRVLRAGL